MAQREISQASFEDLSDWLKIMARKIERAIVKKV